jgi:primosomal protein N' (replication factor Y) (superfamily II helicase)
MFAELVINIEAALEDTFHYFVPPDLRPRLRVGHLVEVEFGSRLAQGIIIGFDEESPVPETKPVIGLIDEQPVVQWWQIELAHWLSANYLAPLNGCLRLMLPPGLTRWSDIRVDINPYWDGDGRLTDLQQVIIDLLRENEDLRGRQLAQLVKKRLPKKQRSSKSDWQTAVNQLVKRDILRKASVLDPPRVRPKQIRVAELSANWSRVRQRVTQLGRKSLEAEVLAYLADSDDPLPEETAVLGATGAKAHHIQALIEANLINRTAAQTLIIPAIPPDTVPAEYAAILYQLPTTEDQLTIDNYQLSIVNLEKEGLIQRQTTPATLSLTISPDAALPHILERKGATTYWLVLNYLAEQAQPIPVGDLYAATDSKISHLRKLAKLDLIRLGSEEVWRDSLADRDFVPATAPLLTQDQARVWGRIKVAMLLAEDDDEAVEAIHIDPFILHGVTGSGKTEIYMRAIELALVRGQSAIVLVPEIALTPQTVRRFAARFAGRVAVLHSRLSPGERYDTWRRARAGLFDIVVGPRSALFTPLPNLGVIVLDEEHDPSYKQTPPVPPPYYHTRDTAIEMGRILKAVVILGSATPDVVTYHRARAGRYQLLELPRRIMGHRQRLYSQAERLRIPSERLPGRQHGDDPDDAMTIPLPPIQVVDLRQELRAGNRSIFSRTLEKAINETLERGEQAILFLNRRGTATFIICRDCGHVLACPRCEMPLTYHRPHMALICHYCGRQEPPHGDCPQCGSKRIRYFGLGTEEVAQRVQQRWPEARITRWDRDTTAGKDSHEALLAGFINQEADILVGTQMIAKGLDLPLVTLVGVISADVSLGLPDYRTGERAFQVLAQVAGRAGRGLLGGRVIIQTYKPEHYAIQAAAEHDFAGFYVDEIRFRTQHMLPPFRRLAKLVIVDHLNDRGKRQAEELAQGLRRHIRELGLAATEILGPVPPFFGRIDGRYRWQIVIRSPDPIRLLADFPIPTQWIVDIDPVSLL